MDAAASAALELKYKQLWTQYRLTVTGLYFSDKPLSGNGGYWLGGWAGGWAAAGRWVQAGRLQAGGC